MVLHLQIAFIIMWVIILYIFLINNTFIILLNNYFQTQHTIDIKTSVLTVRGKSQLVTLDYAIDTSDGQTNSKDPSSVR